MAEVEPLGRHRLHASRDIDQFHAFITAVAGPHDRRQLERGEFIGCVNGVSGGEISLAWASYNRRTWLRVPPISHACYVHLFQKGYGDYQFTSGPATGDPGHAVLILPGDSYEATYSALSCLVVGIEGPFLQRELVHRHGPGCHLGSPSTRSLDLTSSVGHALLDVVGVLRATVENHGSGFLTRPAVARSFDGALAGLVLAGFYSGADNVDATPHGGTIGALAAFVDDNLHRPLSLGDLCAATGLGSRALQRACRSRWGHGPMAYLAQRRLAEARARLLQPDSGTTVTDVALDCGFNHLGRFAAGYREHFGETPSRTLAEAHRRGRPLR